MATSRIGQESPDSLEFNHSFTQEPSEWHAQQQQSEFDDEHEAATRELKMA
jgi:hypothetical protein